VRRDVGAGVLARLLSLLTVGAKVEATHVELISHIDVSRWKFGENKTFRYCFDEIDRLSLSQGTRLKD
jgi:hypothetical protein